MQDSAATLHGELKPCLAELLRTSTHPPTLVLKVEYVLGKAQAGSRRNAPVGHTWNQPQEGYHPPQPRLPAHDSDREVRAPWCLRLALSDGDLQIQAILAKRLHTQELLELQKGDLIEVRDFQVRSAARISGQGKVIYLGVQHCAWIGREQATEPQLDSEGGFIREDEAMARNRNKPRRKATSALSRTSSDVSRSNTQCLDGEDGCHQVFKGKQTRQQLSGGRGALANRQQPVHSDDSEDDYFDTISVSQSQMDRHREILHQIEHNIPIQTPTNPNIGVDGEADDEELSGAALPLLESRHDDDVESNGSNDYNDAGLAAHHAVIQQQDQESTSITRPPPRLSLVPSTAPLHTLLSLLNPASSLPQRNYACTILGVITWVSTSLIHKPNTPYPPKRHAKVHDLSISHRQAGITLAVFVDATSFLPRVGTVALLRGVVMQRCQNDVILNKYPGFGNRVKEDDHAIDYLD